MNAFDRVEQNIWQTFTPGTSLHRIDLMGMMNEIPISSKGPKEGTALFLQYTERNAAYFNRFNKNLEIWEVLRRSSRTTGHWQDKLRMCIVYRSIQSWQDVSLSGKEVLKRDCEQHALRRLWDTFIKMMMGLISSAKDICMVFGICDDLGKINEFDIERQRYTASCLLLQESRRGSIYFDNMQLNICQVTLPQKREIS